MKWYYLVLITLYCAGIFWMSSQSRPVPVGMDIPHLDKPAHMVVYGVLAALVSIGMYRSRRNYTRTVQFYIPWAFATLYGISDEIHQYFVPGRSFDLLDIAANMSGAYIAQLILCYGCWKLHCSHVQSQKQLWSTETD